MWFFRIQDDRWSIHDIVVHLADSEVSSYLHCRRIIIEPGISLLEFDSGRWARSLGYFHQTVRESLEIIERIRKTTHHLLRSIPDSAWTHKVEHPRMGEVTLKRWLLIQERHIPHHVEQMKENYTAWREGHPPRKPALHSRHGLATPFDLSAQA